MAKSILFAGLDPDIEKELRGDFKSSLLIRKRISKILNDKVETSRKDLRNKDHYADGSWSHRMADQLGYERALYEIISLLTEEEK